MSNAAKEDDGDDGRGCLAIIAFALLGFGIGSIWGAPYGMLAVGVVIIVFMVLKV